MSESSTSQYLTFYIDDSAVEIGSQKHIILAAVCFPDEDKATADWLGKKHECGLHPYDEVKWNDSSIPFEQRREFVPILNSGIGIVLLDDSTKQAAAERLCEQVWWYCHVEKKDGFRLRFDKDIVENRKQFKAHVRGFYPPCVGFSEHDSECEQLVQCADFLAGAIKLKVDFGLGRKDPNMRITVRNEMNSTEEMEVSSYFFAALRYCLWGVVHDFGDGTNTSVPRKLVMGRGVRINSSVPADVLDKATHFIDGDYMGCIH